MNEFANTIRERAAEALKQIYRQEPTPGMDPVVELVGLLLGDEMGGVQSPEVYSVTTEQWLTWNQMAMEQPKELARSAMTVLKREQMNLPTEPEALRNWAEWLLLATLDQIEME